MLEWGGVNPPTGQLLRVRGRGRARGGGGGGVPERIPGGGNRGGVTSVRPDGQPGPGRAQSAKTAKFITFSKIPSISLILRQWGQKASMSASCPPGPPRWLGYVQSFRPSAARGAQGGAIGHIGAKVDNLAKFLHFHPKVRNPAPDG